jgi:uncharacterized membrane protein YdbT with pleckstrin-like domain
MGYIEHNLLVGEEVVYRAKKHWKVFLLPSLFLLAGLGFFISSLFYQQTVALPILGAALSGLAIIFSIGPLIEYQSSEFAVTNKRVLIKVGFIRRHSLELLLNKVEGIGVDQGILGRIFNYGTMSVIGTGGTRESFKDIARPLEFRKQVQSRVAGS